MSAQYIFTTHRLSRRFPPDKEVLKDISLSFLPGAKIGVLGYNGSGKSTLLRIMAGLDADFGGQAQLAPGASVGLLEQEPAARPGQGRPGQHRGGGRRRAGAARPVQRAVDELLRRDRGGDGRGAGADRRGRRLEPRHDPRDRDGRAPLSAAGRRRLNALRRRAAPRRAVPAAAPPARPAAARRADQPPRRRVRGLARATPAGLPRHRRGVTHDRYFLDNVAGWILELDRGRGDALSRATTRAGSSRSARGSSRRHARRSRASARSSASSSGSG